MIKFSKLNSKLFVLAIGLCAFVSCEKDTGNVGLGTLPSDDGFYVFEDSVSLTGFTTVSDYRSFVDTVYDSYNVAHSFTSYMLGSVSQKLSESVTDNVVAESDIVFRFPSSPGSIDYGTPKSISFVFEDQGYVYGDPTKPVSLEIWAIAPDWQKIVTTVDYSGSDNCIYRKSDTVTIPLSSDLLNYFVAGIAKTIETYPMRASGYYSTDSSLLAARYFYENYFQGFKVQVKGHPDAFISRIYNPRVVLNYQINKSDIQEEFIMSSAPLVAIDTNYAKNTTFTPKGTIFRHSANSSVLNGTSGILIQGGAGYQTLVDMSPIASWIDSTNMLINKAVVQFTVEDTVGAEPSSSLVLTMYDKLNQKTLFSFEKDYNETLGTYTFEIQEMLNTFINNGVPLKDNYQFTLSCPEPNTTVNKTRLSSKDGVKINIIYSKY